MRTPIDYREFREVERAITRDEQTRHVVALLRKCGPQTRDYLVKRCCDGDRKALNEIVGVLVATRDVAVERGQVRYVRVASAGSSALPHVAPLSGAAEGQVIGSATVA